MDDLLRQVSEMQEAVVRLHSIKGAKREIDRLFNDHVPVGDNTEKEEP